MIFALYIPKPSEFTEAITQLAITNLVLCALALRIKLSVQSVLLAGVLMAAGGVIAIAPDLYFAFCSRSYSTAFFEITAYFHVGRGKIAFLIGMGIALVLYAIVVEIQAKAHQPHRDAVK